MNRVKRSRKVVDDLVASDEGKMHTAGFEYHRKDSSILPLQSRMGSQRALESLQVLLSPKKRQCKELYRYNETSELRTPLFKGHLVLPHVYSIYIE